MIQLTFEQLSKILSLDPAIKSRDDNRRFHGVSTDTRTLEKGNLFVGLLGEQGIDGAKFVPQAIEKGAAAVLVNEGCQTPVVSDTFLTWKVPDTVKALGQIATYWRNQFELPIIAVTGSNGKTTIKNMLGAILRAACSPEQVLVAHSSFNNHIGVPLNLFKLGKQHRYAALEMGMSHFGEIEYLTKMVRPNIAIISNALPCHLEGVGDLDGVARAKAEIFAGLESNKYQQSCAVLNADDQCYEFWEKHAGNHNIMSFSLENSSNVMAKNLNLNQNSSEFILRTNSDEIEITLPLLGKHNVLNALAAATACLASGISLFNIKKGLEAVSAEEKRLQIVQTKQGAQILNDCYNANPASLQAAVDVLVTYPGRKILVLGDMQELSINAEDLHAEAGEYAKKAGVDEALVIGELTKHFALAFGAKAQHFANKEDLVRYLQTLLAKDTTILVKGSRSMKLEEIVTKILQV
ncbi:MAG: UDP-N-acetylmuramoyl-tripeptide--D-alanyl-D-alanine ligase [Gammaproteobacteria bacterium]|jgi:UDP-N-acetylmuramoyl-tripeptide--D-alanyl-D-alanine ligase